MKQFHDRPAPEKEEVDVSTLRPSVFDARTKVRVTVPDAPEPKLAPLQKYQLSPEIASSILQSRLNTSQENGLPENSRLAGLRVMARSADSYQTAENEASFEKK